MKIKCCKDYEEVAATTVESVDAVYWWINDGHKNPDDHDAIMMSVKRNHRLFQHNRDFFLRKFGRQTFCWVNYVARRFYVWVVPLENVEMIILTHGEKGTCYEFIVTGDKSKAPQEIIDFLDGIQGEIVDNIILE